MDVVCIGQAVVDCIVRGKEEKEHRKNVYRAESIHLSVGGDAVNESSVLAELGHDVSIVCGLGKDYAGKMILQALEGHGVSTNLIQTYDSLVTPIANLIVNGDGSRSSINSKAVMLDGFVPDFNVVKDAKIVSLCSLFRAPFDQKEIVIDLVRKAKAEGCLICADTKLPAYRNIHMNDIKEILPMIDYIFPNENEAGYYTGQESFEGMAASIQEMGVKNVIIKTGASGCTVYGEKEHFQVAARKVRAIDSTGAGDNFVAGFLSGLLKGYSLRECTEFGTDCAAMSVQYSGATAGIMEWKKKNFSRSLS